MLKGRLNYANVMATLAVFIALCGSAVASQVVIKRSIQVKSGVITGKKIKRGTITLNRLSKGARLALRGRRGTAGLQGPVGAAGATGTTGPQGLEGLQGLAGETGPQGAQGLQGLQGLQGVQGLTGDVGAQGLQGPQGIQGPTGDTGAQGPIGLTGPQGPAGLDGAPGLVRAYGRIAQDGSLDSSRSNAGIVSARKDSTGVYCVRLDPDIDATAASPQLGLDFASSDTLLSGASSVIGGIEIDSDAANCTENPNEVEIRTFKYVFALGVISTAALSDQGFFVAVP